MKNLGSTIQIILLVITIQLVSCSEEKPLQSAADCDEVEKEEEKEVPCEDPSSSRMAVHLIATASEEFGFVEYLPCNYSATNEAGYPLILYYPGVGEVGNGSEAAMEKMLRSGPPKLINSDQWPPQSDLLESAIPDRAIVISPQFDRGVWGGYGCPTPDFMQTTLQYAVDHYNVDPSRIYMIGVSCGVWGIRDYCSSNPNCSLNGIQVAGIIGLSGNFKMEETKYCRETVNQPLWLFHGEDDRGSTPPTGSTDPYYAIEKCAGFDSEITKLTTFSDLGHSGEVWDKVLSLNDERLQQILDDEGIDPYSWLYAQRGE